MERYPKMVTLSTCLPSGGTFVGLGIEDGDLLGQFMIQKPGELHMQVLCLLRLPHSLVHCCLGMKILDGATTV